MCLSPKLILSHRQGLCCCAVLPQRWNCCKDNNPADCLLWCSVFLSPERNFTHACHSWGVMAVLIHTQGCELRYLGAFSPALCSLILSHRGREEMVRTQSLAEITAAIRESKFYCFWSIEFKSSAESASLGGLFPFSTPGCRILHLLSLHLPKRRVNQSGWACCSSYPVNFDHWQIPSNWGWRGLQRLGKGCSVSCRLCMEKAF